MNVEQQTVSARPLQDVAAALRPELERALEPLREQLLDIGNRNRLISTPVGNRWAKQLRIIDEVADELFDILFTKHRSMSFQPTPARSASVCWLRPLRRRWNLTASPITMQERAFIDSPRFVLL